MNGTNGAAPWRCLLVATVATAALAGLVLLVLPELVAARDALASGRLAATPFTDLLAWWCAACALTAAAWLWSGTVTVALTAASGRCTALGLVPQPRWAPAVLPVSVRRVVLLACGVALTGALTAPAQAATGHPAGPAAAPAASPLSGLPLPDRATGRAPRSAAAARPALPLPRPAHRVASVVVRPGDTLWDLARQALPGPAADDDVARRWQQVYALNRDVVGPDPDLIRPGQRLRLSSD